MSFSIRALVFAAPLVGSLATTYVYRAVVPAPAGLLPTIAWWIGAIATVMVSMRMFDHSARRLLPVAVLFRMSLAFPDSAPNRFKTALKTGTTRQLQRQLDEIEAGTTTTTPNEAAETLLALIARLSTHDRQTRGHSERVRGYTDLIAKEMDLPAADREKLHWAALIHDVGKLRVPPEILNKKGQPTDEEWEILKSHPGASERLVDPLRGWLGDWALATTQHHERYDGKGYPNGLAGTEISLAGRIVAVADAYDVMTAMRSYKKPLPAAQARAELTKNSGTQFDPAVVRAFLAVGLGKTRVFLGPLAWLSELQRLIQVPAAASTSVGTMAAAAVTAAAVSVGSVMAIGGPTDISSTEPIERVVEEPPGPALEITDESSPVGAGGAQRAGPPLSSPITTETGTTTTTTTTVPSTTTTTPATKTTPVTTTTPATTTTTPVTSTSAPATTTTTPVTTTTPATTTTTPVTTTTASSVGPSAFNDFASVSGATAHISVLDNDTENGFAIDITSLSIIVPPAHAQNYAAAAGEIRYHARSGYDGDDELTYRICDMGGGCDTATLYLKVSA